MLMYCLNNIDRITYPSKLVMELTKLYHFKGKDYFYADLFKNDLQTMVKETIEKDTYYAAKILKLNLSDNRLKLLINKNSNPKTSDEKIVCNLKTVFKIIQEQGNDLEINDNEFIAVAKKIFNGAKEISYAYETVEVQVNLLKEKKRVYYRQKIKELLDLYKRIMNSDRIEATQLATNFYIDMINIKPYTDENDFLCLLIYYCLLCKERFQVFRYVSFFEKYYEIEDEFKNAVIHACYNWKSGFSQTEDLNQVTIQMMLEGYYNVESKCSAYSFDKKIKKIESVESSILKLGEIFTKDEIRAHNPYLSDSTINRALDNLKKENKIRSNGTGRSATWIRIIDTETFDPKNKQMSLFEVIDE